MTEQKRSEHGEAGAQQTNVDPATEDLDVSEAQGEDVRGGISIPYGSTEKEYKKQNP